MSAQPSNREDYREMGAGAPSEQTEVDFMKRFNSEYKDEDKKSKFKYNFEIDSRRSSNSKCEIINKDLLMFETHRTS